MRTPKGILFVLVFANALGCFSDPGTAPIDDTASNNGTIQPNNDTSDAASCEPSDEICDGIDNDCDGDVDEDFAVGEECSAGLGVCTNVGVMVCNDSLDDVECDAEEGTPETGELCDDGLDNDCDGAIDEGFDDLGDDCTAGLGVCELAGVMVCAEDLTMTTCGVEVPAPPEADEVSCDGLDNDCDGLADEGCDDDGDGVCDAALTLVSPQGDAICPGGGDDCDDTDADVYPGAPGLCDGKDNDCVDGIDEIKRGRVRTYSVPDFAALDLENSPIQAIASDTGFCIHMTGGSSGARTVTRAVIRSAGAAISSQVDSTTDEGRVVDIAFSGARCGSLVVAEDADTTRDAYAYWWTYGFTGDAMNRVVTDGITHIAPSWDATLTFADGKWIVGYSTTSGSSANYTTIRENFNATDTPAVANTVGLNGTFPELGDHPGTPDLLFMSNFFNINVHQLDVGDLAAALPAMQIPSSVSRSNLVMNTVDGETWFAARNAGTTNVWEIRRISTTPDYADLGTVPYATSPQPEDFLSRNVFVAGPAGAVWFLDGIDEKFASISSDGAGGLDVVDIVDPAATGDLLTARAAAPDVTEALWLTDAGTATRDAVFEAVEYTCY